MRARHLVTLLFLLAASVAAQPPLTPVNPRTFPLDPSPLSTDIFWEQKAASFTNYHTTLGQIRSGLVATSYVLTCTPPLLCAGGSSADLSAPRTLSIALASLGGLTTTSGALAFDYSQTLAGSPALSAGQCIFSGSGSGGLLCEGATVDNFETFLTVADPTADRTITLPNVTGTVVTSGDTATVTPTMLDRSYLQTAGVAGGQSVTCGTAASNGCSFVSTSSGTKGTDSFGGTVLVVDEVNSRVGVGTATPATLVEIKQDANAGAEVRFNNPNAGNSAQVQTRWQTDTAAALAICRSSTNTGTTFGIASAGYCDLLLSTGNGLRVGTIASAPMALGTNNTLRATLPATNNHLTYSGTAPTMSCTGVGSSPPASSCAGTDMGFTCLIKTGTSPGAAATCTLTFNAAIDTNKPPLVCMLVDGTSAWGAGLAIHQTVESLTAPVIVASQTANLTGSSDYKFHCLIGPWK